MSVEPTPKTPSAAGKPAVAEPPRKRSLLGGMLGWIVVPGTLAAALVALGVHVGANHPDMWFSRLLIWLIR